MLSRISDIVCMTADAQCSMFCLHFKHESHVFVSDDKCLRMRNTEMAPFSSVRNIDYIKPNQTHIF